MEKHTRWYKDSIIYSLHIHSFFDSTGNGIGDINGLIQKLDYLEDLGINCISLLPFYPSPLRDDGYDITDFCDVHPDYGTLAHFEALLREAHQRGIRIVIDVIMNHTSVEHPWFQRARRAAAGSAERDFYVWSDNRDEYPDASVIFKDYESSNWAWDTVAGAYYWHRFYSHQADLNYDHPDVRAEMLKVIDFWFDLGVDGIRLSSVMYTARQSGTNCENLPAVHQYLRELRKYVDSRHADKILLAEANLWPEEAAEYFGQGDECHVNSHFPLMPRLFMALLTEDRYPILDIIEQTPEVPGDCQWALFLRNHDDLMLSMVTEEERDYLTRMLAQDQGARINQGIRRRLAPLLGNDRRKMELLNFLLFSLAGSPVIYYGDEIGMGDNIYLSDRNGMRTPMQWSSNQNAGFSTANPQKLMLPVIRDPLYRYEAVNVEVQQDNAASLLWWMKNLIAMRKHLKALGNGSTTFLNAANSKVLAFLRLHEGESLLVLCNLSKFTQALTLDLSAYQGVEPMEVFSQNKFFAIGEEPYRFTLAPYSYHWFVLEQPEASESAPKDRIVADMESGVNWPQFFDNYAARRHFEKKILPGYMRLCRWFSGKSRRLVSIDIPRYPMVTAGAQGNYLLNIVVRYTDGMPETYFLPVTFITQAEVIVHYLKNELSAVVCYLKTPLAEGIIVDAIYEADFRNELLWLIQNNREISLQEGYLKFEAGKILSEAPLAKGQISSQVLRAEQSNTSVIYNDRFFFKIYRKLDTDINPDLELVRFLSEQTGFTHAPSYGGGIQYSNLSEKSYTILGLLQNKIPNQGEAWTAMLAGLGTYYEQVLGYAGRQSAQPPVTHQRRMYFEDFPEVMQQFIGREVYDRVVLLAQRTAEMHIALASEAASEEDFAPEAFTEYYQRSIYSGHRKLVSEKLRALEQKISTFDAGAAAEAREILAMEADILAAFSRIFSHRIDTVKTRIHGDYHLGQVLFDGSDFFIIDFEGEPMLPISERRLKKTPLKDVAGMIRSFHYAAYGQLLLSNRYKAEDMPVLEDWAQLWFHYISQSYFTAYLHRAEGQPFLPREEADLQTVLRSYLLEKAIYEVGYEMNARPAWVRIPLRGVKYVMGM